MFRERFQNQPASLKQGHIQDFRNNLSMANLYDCMVRKHYAVAGRGIIMRK